MKNDMWAIGVIAYILICQEQPFQIGRDGQNKDKKKERDDFIESFNKFENYEDWKDR